MTKVFTKTITLAILLLSVSLFATCPEWVAAESYETGDKISYNGDLYVAMRAVPSNTPPATSDNGWFWQATTEACDSTVTVIADEYIVKINNKFSTMPRTFTMDQSGVNLKRDHPTGGNVTSKVAFGTVSVMDSTYHVLDESSLTPTEVKVRFKSNGSQYEKYTKVTADGVSIVNSPVSGGSFTGTKIDMSNQSGTATIEPGQLTVSTSFGQTIVNDNGVRTDKAIVSGTVETGLVKAQAIELNNENLLAIIAELEARIAALENQQ